MFLVNIETLEHYKVVSEIQLSFSAILLHFSIFEL